MTWRSGTRDGAEGADASSQSQSRLKQDLARIAGEGFKKMKDLKLMESYLKADGWVTDGVRSYRDSNGEDILAWTNPKHPEVYVVVNCMNEWEFSRMDDDADAGASPGEMPLAKAVEAAYEALENLMETEAEIAHEAALEAYHGGWGTSERWGGEH